ncbi:DinB family protein [Tellurirhabdus bombi]|uniref:DinB family protein n=1 Tax=Tellurirhabdus bombi TaxID=2907205 RepID=UPI001F3ED03A|nr:DinB family protein [Tellurirhabdus bombi]
MKDHLLRLLDYERWANQAVLEALETVESPPPRAIKLMGHILSAQQVWISRIVGETPFAAIWEDVPLVWLHQTAEKNYLRLRELVEAQEDVHQPISYANSAGQSFVNPLSDILTHLSHHAAYHRAQVVQLIRPQLVESPKTDFIFWARA